MRPQLALLLALLLLGGGSGGLQSLHAVSTAAECGPHGSADEHGHCVCEPGYHDDGGVCEEDGDAHVKPAAANATTASTSADKAHADEDAHMHEEEATAAADDHAHDDAATTADDEHAHEDEAATAAAADEHAADDEHAHEDEAATAAAADEHAADDEHAHEDEAATAAAADEHAHEGEAGADVHADEGKGEASSSTASTAAADPHAGHGHGGGDCTQDDMDDYNLGLHIGAVFILFGVSAAGTILPVIMALFRSRVFVYAIRFGMFFGFGTILATSLIHMLLPANYALASPCLTGTWANYEAWAFMFAVAAIVFMQAIDYVTESICQRHKEKLDARRAAAAAASAKALRAASSGDLKAGNDGVGAERDVESGDDVSQGSGAVYINRVAHDELELCSGHALIAEADPSDWSQPLGFYLAEAGIIFHSMMIGFTLGTTSGSTFTTLLIALSFHQFFEGLAIGAAALGTGLSKPKCVLVGMIYSITTPSGIAIGIAVRESLNTNSSGWLITEGILESLAAGILIYVVLVELITPMMTKSHWLRQQHWAVQALGLGFFWAGAAVMAVIGTWA